MELIPLTTQHPDFEFTFTLWHDTFPLVERRTDKMQQFETDHNPYFNNALLRHAGQNIGLITYWQFQTFRFVEHFAISPMARNGGYGGKSIEALYSLSPLPLVLEVEHPTTIDSARRIAFYQRHQFVLWSNPYLQPPYAEGYPEIPMYLMVRGDLSPRLHFETIKTQIYREVYRLHQ